MSDNIQGKIVVITGASSGLGEATARLLSTKGAILVLGARRQDRLKALAETLASAGIAAALPHMNEQNTGHFINVSSAAGHRVGPGFAVYAATKHAVLLSEGLRREVKPSNIRTTVISTKQAL